MSIMEDVMPYVAIALTQAYVVVTPYLLTSYTTPEPLWLSMFYHLSLPEQLYWKFQVTKHFRLQRYMRENTFFLWYLSFVVFQISVLCFISHFGLVEIEPASNFKFVNTILVCIYKTHLICKGLLNQKYGYITVILRLKEYYITEVNLLPDHLEWWRSL